jgi:hypothetical protein
MKLLLCFLICLSFAHAEEPLKSSKIKLDICSEIEDELSEDISVQSFDVEKCTKGKFEVTDKTYNARLNSITRLEIKYSFTQNSIDFEGDATADRKISFNRNGGIQARWNVSEVFFDYIDSRDTLTIVNAIFDHHEINVHNGGYGASKVNATYGKKQMMVELESTLENSNDEDSCVFDTDTDKNWNMKTLADYDLDFATWVEEQNSKGNIEEVISRSWTGDGGDSEYCLYNYYYILTKDNVLIYLDFDFTT